MAAPMSDEELYQLTGSWEAAAALRDEQARAANQNTQTAAANVVAPSGNFTLDDLKALYKEKGATEQRITQSGDAGDVVDYIPIQYGSGWSAFENDNRKIIDYIGSGMDAQPVYDDAAKTLGGFSRQEGDYVYNYDPEGKYLGRTKWNESNLKTLIRDLGPLAMAAVTMGGGGAFLGNSLFGLTGNAASAAGGALAGGINAYGNDQDILKGALFGGISGAGTAKLSDILGADALGGTFKNATLSDVSKAVNFAKDPTLAGAANLASPYVTTNFNIGDTGFTTNDLLKGVNTVQALGSKDNKKIFDTITGLAKGTDFSGLTASEQEELAANREIKRLNRIEDAVLNQPASDDGSTQGIVDLISEMYPAADIKGMSQGDLAKFLEANINDIQGSAELETLLKGAGQTTADEGTLTVTGDRPTGLGDFMLPTDNVSNVADKGEMVITGNRNGTSLNDFLSLNAPAGDITNNYTDDLSELVVTGNKNGTSLSDFISLNTPAGNITDNYADDTVFVTGNKDGDYVPSLRTKEIKSDIPDELTVDDIDTLFPNLDINDILQTVTVPGGTKTVVPTTKTTTPTVKKTTEDLMDSLGLNRQAPSQDPYANIKLMEELFGGDVAYKLRALGAPKNLASADMDALVKLLRG
jgi:hypothetical protein